MSTKTENLQLNKPDVTDVYDIAVQNENMDIIDDAIGALNDAMNDVDTSIITSHVADTTVHITSAERTKWDSKANGTHTHTKSQIIDFPTSLPANDVPAWAKAATKPAYTKAEVGLGSVDNTADADKNVRYATSAGNADTLDGLHAASFIQTSQSAKVIVSATAPTDTTAVWIVPS